MVEQTRIPENTLDYNMQLVNPAWSDAESTLNEAAEDGALIEHNGETYVKVEYLLNAFKFITRDVRLSNLEKADVTLLRNWISFAGLMADQKRPKSFKYSVRMIAAICETSQGKGGFVRKLINTLRQENIQSYEEPSKRSFFTGKRQE